MTNVVIVNRRGIQMRQSNGRYAAKIVPPAVAASIGPNTPAPRPTGVVRRSPGPNSVVPVEQVDHSVGPGVYSAQSPTPPGAGYRVVK